ncbi:MAG: DEAD/DEAH box helicase [Candidatus Eisenbacteria sp.]|nr:DEAD/DEAH box helicase [Candidatus Eisenbacteria bacterium]
MATATPQFIPDGTHFDEHDLFDLASERIVRRGLVYARAGRVTDLVETDGRLEARVEGTRREPYLVNLEYDGDEILPSCTCPFDWEPFCKHAIATLAVHLGWVDPVAGRPGSRVERSDFAADRPDSPAQRKGRLASLEQEEVEVRRRRGAKGGFKVIRRDAHDFFGTFEVRSPSEKAYEVEIRSLSTPVNQCTCLDFATCTLGTCKHVEAVLTALRRRSRRKFAKAAAQPPAVGQILVDRRDVPRIRLRLPPRPTPALAKLAHEHFDSEGYFRGDPVEDLPELLASARRLRKAVIYRDVVEFSGRVAAERRAARRKEEVSRQLLTAGGSIPGMQVDLYPFQVEGTAFLAASGRALLGDDMGLGKTVQAIAAARVLWDRGEIHRALVVCPASLKAQWASEIKRFTGIDCQIVGGGVAHRLAQYRRQAPFTIANYELVLRDRKGIRDLAPDLLILDEAQRIRNWRTKTAEAIKSIEIPYAFVLTGTPLQNRLDDLYSVMQIVDRRIMGPLWAYNESFVVRDEGKSRIRGYKNLDELRRRIAPTLLRRTKEEVRLQLPDRIDSRISVELTAKQMDLMQEAVATAARYAALAEKRPLSPVEEKRLFMAMQNARMACNAAGLVDKETVGSPKLDEFEQLIRDLCLDRGRKVIVFSEWEKFCRLAAQRAERLGIPFVRLHGGVPSAKRGALIERFRDDPECKIFFSTDAGGLGLNLQFVSTMIILELPWNPAVLDQRIGRIHRHGQTEPVNVLLLVSEDSFESGLEATLQSKRALFSAALDQSARESAVEAPSSCLAIVRAALLALESEEEPGEEPIIVDAGVAGAVPGKPPIEERDPQTAGKAATATEGGDSAPASGPADTPVEGTDPVRKIGDLLGPRLRRVVALSSGRTVALVDRVDRTTREAAAGLGIVVVEAQAVESLALLGEESPFASARVLLDRPAGRPDLQAERRRRLAVAARKLEAARTLAAAGLGAEAIAQGHACMTAALQAMTADATETEDLPSARLLYERLVPQGLLSLEQAALVSRADGLARAYSEATQPVPPGTVEAVLEDARGLLEHAAGLRGARPSAEGSARDRAALAGVPS